MRRKHEEEIKTYILCIRFVKLLCKIGIAEHEWEAYQWAQRVYDMPKKTKQTTM